MINTDKLKTSEDVLNDSKLVIQQAKRVKDRESHARVWDAKVDVLRVINEALETGGLNQITRSELLDAKSLLFDAEAIAGRRAQETYR